MSAFVGTSSESSTTASSCKRAPLAPWSSSCSQALPGSPGPSAAGSSQRCQWISPQNLGSISIALSSVRSSGAGSAAGCAARCGWPSHAVPGVRPATGRPGRLGARSARRTSSGAFLGWPPRPKRPSTSGTSSCASPSASSPSAAPSGSPSSWRTPGRHGCGRPQGCRASSRPPTSTSTTSTCARSGPGGESSHEWPAGPVIILSPPRILVVAVGKVFVLFRESPTLCFREMTPSLGFSGLASPSLILLSFAIFLLI